MCIRPYPMVLDYFDRFFHNNSDKFQYFFMRPAETSGINDIMISVEGRSEMIHFVSFSAAPRSMKEAADIIILHHTNLLVFSIL